MNIVRTPDDRFANLPGYAFSPNYIDTLQGFADLRMHYLDEGPRDAAHVFLCLHGQPTWSYLYRRMIPPLVAAGHRVVTPDFFGFGKSDKPVEEGVYTFDFHRSSLLAFINALDLKRITVVCQDWGGLLGLTLPMAMSDRFDRLLAMNTMLATGDTPLSDGFLAWRKWNNANPDMAVGRLMKRSCPQLSEAEAAAYDAPYPDASYKAGVRRFPNLVPDSLDAPGAELSRRARQWWRTEWRGGSFMAVGAADPVLGPPVMSVLHETVRGCPPMMIIEQAGHFVQEWGELVVPAALKAFG
jgi:pimeloyl-ACP methyl ester carboxylesterase